MAAAQASAAGTAKAIVQAIHRMTIQDRLGPRVVATAAGGGNLLGAYLLSETGASCTVLTASTPYARSATAELLGSKPKSMVTADVALEMAGSSLMRAKRLGFQELGVSRALHDVPVYCGVAVTASLAAPGKAGPHRACIATATDTARSVMCVNLLPAEREEEDVVTSTLAIALLADAMGVPGTAGSWVTSAAKSLGMGLTWVAEGSGVPSLPSDSGHASGAGWGVGDPLSGLLDGTGSVGSLLYAPVAYPGSTGTITSPPLPPGTLILPGSFNPLHSGHEGMMAGAQAVLSSPPPGALPTPWNGLSVFELSGTNVDKPPLEQESIYARVAQFTGVRPDGKEGVAAPPAWPSGTSHRSGAPAAVLVTAAPMFAEKAALFPGCFFVLGVDTAVRLLDGKYYAAGHEGMLVALGGMAASGCRILVAGRVGEAGFIGLADMEVPPALQELFIEVPEAAFRADVSSTQLRAQAGAGR